VCDTRAVACAVVTHAVCVHQAALPAPSTVLPREKPAPKAKATTRWEAFAKEKGIKKRKRERMLWDDEKQQWLPRWGFNVRICRVCSVPFTSPLCRVVSWLALPCRVVSCRRGAPIARCIPLTAPHHCLLRSVPTTRCARGRCQ
jgi:hypothetical protein